MKRIEKFNKLREHPWYGKKFKQLTKANIQFCEDWLTEHEHLDRREFELASNRMVLNRGMSEMTKKERSRLLLCIELCACCK